MKTKSVDPATFSGLLGEPQPLHATSGDTSVLQLSHSDRERLQSLHECRLQAGCTGPGLFVGLSAARLHEKYWCRSPFL